MQKNCKKCLENFEITNEDLEFYKKISPKFDGKVFEIPSPTLCPECRQQRRLSFRNERNLYKRKCDATWESIVSIYSPDKELKIYSSDFWWSDKWDALDYWIEFDFSKTFFEQFKNLQLEVPRISLFSQRTIDSQYTNQSYDNKECYMSYAIWNCDRVFYSNSTTFTNVSIDVSYTKNSEKLYECNDCNNCFNSKFSSYSNNIRNSIFCLNCDNCSYCIWCVGLNNKDYCIFNKQYSKDEYQEYLNTNNIKTIKNEFDNFKSSKKYINLKNIWSDNVSWSNINNSSNSYNCFDVYNLENCSYSSWIFDSKECFDCYWMWNANFIYEWISVENINKSLFNTIVSDSDNILYWDLNFNSSNLFWCIWLKNKQYCIFNKQYTKEEYNKLVPKIIEKMKTDWEWWEFFPANLSPFWYNETVAKEYFPLEKEKILEQNFNYSEYEAPFPKVEKIIQAKKLPENILDIPDDILNWAIECEISKKPFRIISQELEFYRKHNLPIPHKHPDVRHSERMKLRNPRKLFDRKCDKCWAHIKSTYSPNREEIVYCEKCYKKEVY